VRPRFFKFLLNAYPPYFGTGIRVVRISPDYREILVEMKLRFYNRNYVATHFGGSLYAMVDPFYMLMLIQILGPGYTVWDKAADIKFEAPGRGTVRARFTVDDAMIEEIKTRTADGEKFLPAYTVEVKDDQDQVVARVRKTLYIRRRSPG